MAWGCASARPTAPAPTAEDLYAKGVTLRGEGRRREAAAVWEAGLRVDPDHEPTQVALAGTLITLHDLSRAQELLDAASKSRPNDPRVWNEQGRLYMAAETYEAAAEAFARAFELDPAFHTARLGRIQALVELGDCDGARAELAALRKRQRLFLPLRATYRVRDCQPRVPQ